MTPPTSYYIASGLENVEEVRKLKKVLDDAGWRHTYDWTVHGAVYSEGRDALVQCASDESVGVFEADILVVLLPGGRGTHTELGMAVGRLDVAVFLAGRGILKNPLDIARIVIYSADPELFTPNEKTCAFYHHPYVERYTSMEKMIDALLTDTRHAEEIPC